MAGKAVSIKVFFAIPSECEYVEKEEGGQSRVFDHRGRTGVEEAGQGGWSVYGREGEILNLSPNDVRELHERDHVDVGAAADAANDGDQRRRQFSSGAG